MNLPDYVAITGASIVGGGYTLAALRTRELTWFKPRLSRIEHVGAYYIVKTLDRLVDTQDYYTVAKQLRKQGVPLDIARIILFGRN